MIPVTGLGMPSGPAPPAVVGVPLRLLRLLVAVAGCGSASRAALRLHQSVSAVTRGVQQAETLLGRSRLRRHAQVIRPDLYGRARGARR